MKKYDLDKYRRRSIRLKGYDYTQAKVYFITIVICEQEPSRCFHQLETDDRERL